MPFNFNRRQFIASALAMVSACNFRQTLAKTTLPKLPIPQLVDGTDGAPVDLVIQNGEWSFKPGVFTITWGFSQDYLGPTIRTRQNSNLTLNYQNTLSEGVSVHGHGLHVPGEVDGGPQLEIAPGGRWTPTLPIVQQASTCWYHSHTHGKTGAQVYKGLAGMIIIDDENSDALVLPKNYGVDDLPIIIQDRTFDSAGELVYSLNDAGEDGWLGDTVIINGSINPVATVPTGKVRLRLLNGSNARFYIVQFSDNRTFYKIASDSGFLSSPIPETTMEIGPGERCEIIVDMSDGNTAELLTLFEDEIDAEDIVNYVRNLFKSLTSSATKPSLTLVPDGILPAHTALLPTKLNTITPPPTKDISVVRDFHLGMGGENGGDHGAMGMTINGKAMNMNVINEHVKRGVWERWRIRSNQGEHPFHIHGCSFLIEKIGGMVVPPTQHGWKDTVVVDDDGWSEIIVRFDHLASDRYPYMYHCHILEHEDQGMMGQFKVS